LNQDEDAILFVLVIGMISGSKPDQQKTIKVNVHQRAGPIKPSTMISVNWKLTENESQKVQDLILGNKNGANTALNSNIVEELKALVGEILPIEEIQTFHLQGIGYITEGINYYDDNYLPLFSDAIELA
ncbi:MAG: hypothetical protein EZS28_021020, partial [Streblomastix strix]